MKSIECISWMHIYMVVDALLFKKAYPTIQKNLWSKVSFQSYIEKCTDFEVTIFPPNVWFMHNISSIFSYFFISKIENVCPCFLLKGVKKILVPPTL